MEWHRLWQGVNRRLVRRLGDAGLQPDGRREVLGRLGHLQRIAPLPAGGAAGWLAGRPVVGVDGSVNSFGGGFPYYVALLRAAAVPTQGQPLVREAAYSPLLRPDWLAAGAAQDGLRLRRLQARLEVAVAAKALAGYRPALLLMDGPLVRFDREAKKSFARLARQALDAGAALVGVVENVESSVLRRLLGEDAPPDWAARWDRELLWGVLQPGEVLALAQPVPAGDGEDPEGPRGVAVRRWFLRPGADPAPIALDFLEDQVQADPAMPRRVAAFLMALTPADGRGIPVWTDLVDRHVRITEAELQQAVQAYLDPRVRSQLLVAKRHLRPRF